jgi:hypothetical protein
MKKQSLYFFKSLLLFTLTTFIAKAQNILPPENKIDLSGTWLFKTDSLDKGIEEAWYNKQLPGKIILPGSMTTNHLGNNITMNTPWTGSIVDSSWFYKPEYAKYRVPGNIKVPFWLQPVKYYKGAAWYQKKVTIPASWIGKHIELFIERAHWETMVWVNGKSAGMRNSLGTPHVFDLTTLIHAGENQITVKVDNRVKEFNVGENSHSITDHTQTNWNGLIGKLYIAAKPSCYIGDVQIFPDIDKKQITVQIILVNIARKNRNADIELTAVPENNPSRSLKPLQKNISIKKDSAYEEIIYNMSDGVQLWDEFHPNLYTLTVKLKSKYGTDEKKISFGMRKFSAEGSQFTINSRLTFLRGTLECAIFPKTGYPPTDIDSWLRIFKIARSFGLNHMRFHSWTPPEEAFEAADKMGFYLQVECSSWANGDATIGDGKPLDQYIYDESNRVVKAYGNHPSFCMMAYGNEPAGKHYKEYLTRFVNYWKNKDARRLYTTAGGWPVIDESNYNSTPDPRIQGWGAGLSSIINRDPPRTDYDWRNIISRWRHPSVSHEIGQWCVYPDFKEIKKYTGILKAKNFEIFRDKLQEHGMLQLADSFLLASGKLQTLCYKADIEAALRTPGFAGFQLLDLQDFPGQGTALVGVLNAFWEEKGYVTAKEYNRFCNSTVPLVRFPKMIYLNNEMLSVPIEVANFGEHVLKNAEITWNIKNKKGNKIFEGKLPAQTIALGNGIYLGNISQSMSSVKAPSQLLLTVSINQYQNSWNFFVYPVLQSHPSKDILITQELNDEAIKKLNDGGKVLLTLKKGTVKKEKGGNVAVGFSSIFWNTSWTHNQPPHTLGILCNPKHAAFKYFPTDYYSSWEWWDAMSHSDAIILDSVDRKLKPIVRVIDDWFTARPLALIFECKCGRGKLIVSSIDLLKDSDKRPVAKQLLYSLTQYMSQPSFNPTVEVPVSKIESLVL